MAKNIVPTRMCAGCMRRGPKSELLRVFKTKDGTVEADGKRAFVGRGAYVCKNKECVLKAQKKNGLSRILKTKVTDEIYEHLAALVDEE